MFLAIFLALMFVIFRKDFLLIKYVITVFLADFVIRVFINPKFSPTLIMGRLIVFNQAPEYVGARQKKFAWTIGVILSATMFIHMVVVNSYSPISGTICFICLLFLFFETAFGICLGCKFYPLIFKDKPQHCAGEGCNKVSHHEIQRVSSAQILIVCAFVAFVATAAWFFNVQLSRPPFNLFEIDTAP
jgi:hypothetical protein